MSPKKIKKEKHVQFQGKGYTAIAGHQQFKTKLTPPMVLPNMVMSSWMNDRLPEFAWVLLILKALGRDSGLNALHMVANEIRDWTNRNPQEAVKVDPRLSAIARNEPFGAFLTDILLRHEAIRLSLRPLHIIASILPASQLWCPEETKPQDEEDAGNLWLQLGSAIGTALWHQSDEATDARWFSLVCAHISDRMPNMMETGQLRHIGKYPHEGDLRLVRSAIRAAEVGLSALDAERLPFVDTFWGHCLESTSCVPLKTTTVEVPEKPRVTTAKLRELRGALVEHFHRTTTTSATDSKHEALLGIALYAVRITTDLMEIAISNSPLSRMGVRSVFEAYIVAKYLVMKGDNLFEQYRAHGAGQSKLSFLKLLEHGPGLLPEMVEMETLEELANEDLWMEFREIEIGHWAGQNLRKLASEVGEIEKYERFYPTSSGFVHAQWGAVRETVLTVCVNPLHRAHRIPVEHKMLPDCLGDAAELTNHILGLVDQEYPGFTSRV